MEKKGNAMVTLLMLGVVGGLMTVMIIQSNQDAVPEQMREIENTASNWEDAEKEVGDSMKGALNIGLRDFAHQGYGVETKLWVENAYLPPSEDDMRNNFLEHFESAFTEKMNAPLIVPNSGSTTYEVDITYAVITLEQYTVPNPYGGPDTTEYKIKITGIKLMSHTPEGSKELEYILELPLLWSLYDQLDEKISPATQNIAVALNLLTSEPGRKQCSSAVCSCLPGGAPHTSLTTVDITEAEVRGIMDTELSAIVSSLKLKGIECSYVIDELLVKNELSRYQTVGSPDQVCSTTDAVTGSSPDYWRVWGDEEETDPKEFLVVPDPGYVSYTHPAGGYYKYTGTIYASEILERVWDQDYTTWPIHLHEGGPIPSDWEAPDTGGGPSITLYKLRRGAASLITLKCVGQDDLSIMGGDPDKPGEYSKLMTRVRLRFNGFADCPDINAGLPTFVAGGAGCPGMDCMKDVCDPSTSTSTTCVPDDSELPSSHPCDADASVTGPCASTCSSTACGTYPCNPMDCHHSRSNQAYTDCMSGCSSTCPTPPGSCKLCSACSGIPPTEDDPTYCANGKEKDECKCEMTALQKLQLANPLCEKKELCSGGMAMCACGGAGGLPQYPEPPHYDPPPLPSPAPTCKENCPP